MEAAKGRSQYDCGKGFHIWAEPSQSLTLICDYDKSKLYIVSAEITELNIIKVSADTKLAKIVGYHLGKMERQRYTLYEKYRKIVENKALIVGIFADNRMFYVNENFFIDNVKNVALESSLSALQR